MSGIIYGMIDFNKQLSAVTDQLLPALSCYTIDRYTELKDEGVFMGCGLLHITQQNKTEVLPLYNHEHTQLITADVILDNREELYKSFNLSDSDGKLASDSELILLAYDKWGEACPKYLIGDFAFVIWDKVKEEIFCVRDATGTRTFYYTLDANRFYFGTVIKAVQALSHSTNKLNREWIMDFLSTSIALNQFDCESTPFKDIKQLPPAHYLLINKEGVHQAQYWNPLKYVMPLKLPNDEAYKAAFLEVFEEAVKCRLNTTASVGILLSGGLDSSSVACLAARDLAQRHQNLEAFSSVPMDAYKDYHIPGREANESTYIESLKQAYPNINQHYCKAEGQTAVSNLDHILEVFEYPYKMIENITWYPQALSNAKAQGCTVVLNGQAGNNTISYGNFLTQSLTLIHTGKYFKLAKEITAFSKLHHISRKRVVKKILNISIPYKLKKFLKKKQIKQFDYFKYSLLNPILIKTYHLQQRLEDAKFYQYPERFNDLKEERADIVNLLNFSQVASMEVKSSLAEGIIIRDPTRDKRLIEFCLSLPGDQFVKDGMQRRLIRYSMAGILPDLIRCNIATRGIQGADKLQRLNPYWQDVYKELEQLPHHSNIYPLINIEKYEDHLKALNRPLKEEDWPEVKMFLLVYICNRFITNNQA